MTVRGIRGAIAVAQNESGAILDATKELLLAILAANQGLKPADIGSAFFTLTEDLTATYPAQAARDLGWQQVPLLCGREIPVPGGLPRCIRVLIHWNTDLPQDAIQHVYLGEAACLRPDMNGNGLS
jgi:chorismate mutase